MWGGGRGRGRCRCVSDVWTGWIISKRKKPKLGKEPPQSPIYSRPGPEAGSPRENKNKVVDQPGGEVIRADI